ncbi:hypothetical protein KAR91_35780 [Candidatus Pacearchaeota archaeon]|nr:hypothetical protein [Candidatus Pacearchaeota archaeon]
MASNEEIVTNVLNFTDDEFYNIDQTILNQHEAQLLDMDYFGLAVNAPEIIDTKKQDKLPLIMAVRLSGERDWELKLADNCILVGTNMLDGSVTFAKALVDEKALKGRGEPENPPKGPKPPGLALAAAQLTELDAKNRLQIEWDSGIWALGAIYYDWQSNTVEVELNGDEEIIPQQADSVYPDPNLQGSGAIPSYLPMNKTPKAPASGLLFMCEFSIEQNRQVLNVFGSYAVEVREFHLPKQQIMHNYQGRQENIAAIVPLTIAVLSVDWNTPFQFDCLVPVYGKTLEVGKIATGYFAIDAFTDPLPQPLTPGKYVSYMIMDGRIFGPFPFKVS